MRRHMWVGWWQTPTVHTYSLEHVMLLDAHSARAQNRSVFFSSHFFFFFIRLCRVLDVACVIQFPDRASNPGSLHCKGGVLADREVPESESESRSVVSDSLRPHGILQARILEWVAFLFSRGSFQPRNRTQVLRCRQILYQLSHQGSPRRLEWVACPFSRGSS